MIFHIFMGWLILNEIALLCFLRIAEIRNKRQAEENEAVRLWLELCNER